MDELVVRASHWKRDEDGKRPYKSPTISTPDFLKKKREDEEMQKRAKPFSSSRPPMEPGFFLQSQCNNKGQTAREIITQNHESPVKDGGKWLTNTSRSCSVVAALIATAAFSSATAVSGCVQQTGFPTLEGQPAFDAFVMAALGALCFPVTSLIMFLSILTSRYQEMDDLPTKLILGLTMLFMSIATMLVSFCAGHLFVIEKKPKHAVYPIYAITCLPTLFFAVAQFPLCLDLIKATVAKFLNAHTRFVHSDSSSFIVIFSGF